MSHRLDNLTETLKYKGPEECVVLLFDTILGDMAGVVDDKEKALVLLNDYNHRKAALCAAVFDKKLTNAEAEKAALDKAAEAEKKAHEEKVTHTSRR